MDLQNGGCFSLVPPCADLESEDAVAADVNGGDTRFSPADFTEDGNKTPRLPRWTQQEIFVLINAKREAENRVRRGRSAALSFGSVQPEPKWAVVSSYCNNHGVNRGPVQCRKRWSNLAGDFKKVKEWESGVAEEADSFWSMRSDLRREKKLPGSFDRDVYNVLNGVTAPPHLPTLTLPPPASADFEEKEGEGRDLPVVLFDSGRSAAVDDGLFSDFEPCAPDETPPAVAKMDITTIAAAAAAAASPVSEKHYQETYAKGFTGEGMSKEPLPAPGVNGGGNGPASGGDGRKRKRGSTTEEVEEEERRENGVRDELVQVLERNGRMLGVQMEAQNENCRLEMEQRRGQVDSLIAVMGKLADALGRIADKM